MAGPKKARSSFGGGKGVKKGTSSPNDISRLEGVLKNIESRLGSTSDPASGGRLREISSQMREAVKIIAANPGEIENQSQVLANTKWWLNKMLVIPRGKALDATQKKQELVTGVKGAIASIRGARI